MADSQVDGNVDLEEVLSIWGQALTNMRSLVGSRGWPKESTGTPGERRVSVHDPMMFHQTLENAKGMLFEKSDAAIFISILLAG